MLKTNVEGAASLRSKKMAAQLFPKITRDRNHFRSITLTPRIENWEPWAILGSFIAMGAMFPAVAPNEPMSRLLIALITVAWMAAWQLWPLSVLHRVKSRPIFHKIKTFVWIFAILAIFAAAIQIALDVMESSVSFAGFALCLYLGSFVFMALAFSQLTENQRAKSFIFALVSLYFIPLGAFYLKNAANSASGLMPRPAQIN